MLKSKFSKPLRLFVLSWTVLFLVLCIRGNYEANSKYDIYLSTSNFSGAFTMATGPDRLLYLALVDFSKTDPYVHVLKLIHCRNLTCTKNEVQKLMADNEEAFGFPNILVPPDGLPLIIYPYGAGLRINKCLTVMCKSRSIIDIPPHKGELAVYDIQLAVGRDGFPVIFYATGLRHTTRSYLMKCNDTVCESATITFLVERDNEEAPFLNTFAIGSNGYPVIFYDATTDSGSSLIICEDQICSQWHQTMLDNDIFGGDYSDIIIGTKGYPIIIYTDSSRYVLHLVMCRDLGCNNRKLKLDIPGTNVMVGSQLYLDPTGSPLVLYRDYPYIRLLRCTDRSCNSSNTATFSSDYFADAFSLMSSRDNKTIVSFGTTGKISVVIEQNLHPTLNPVNSHAVNTENSLSFFLTSRDADNAPAQSLSYYMSGEIPPEATLDPSGFFEWTPQQADAGLHRVKFGVIDDGVPPKRDEELTVLGVNSELLFSENFESDANNDKVPDGWKAKRLSNDFLRCKSKYANGGRCAFLFNGNPGESNRLSHLIDVQNITTGDHLVVTVAVQSKQVPVNKLVKLNLTCNDGKQRKVDIGVSEGSAEYSLWNSADLVVDCGVQKLILKVGYKHSDGSLYLDDVAVFKFASSPFQIHQKQQVPLP